MQELRVQSLVGELRSHRPHGQKVNKYAKRTCFFFVFFFLKRDFPDGPVVKNPPSNAEDSGQGTKIPTSPG